ncbi:hypothetical protein RN001_012386 [Aquatica leii]|uniref:Uncharacterized protein n=1 Tax=Aquatica leii TaxID=1421715 RepID=A0AAN7P2Z1_9COLE|nr:hypothetical protein RN001_012386 [Aquatica leii]
MDRITPPPTLQLTTPDEFSDSQNSVSTCFAPTIQEVTEHASESSILNLILNNLIALKMMLDQQNEVLSELRAGKVNIVTTEFDLVPKKPFVKFRKLLVFDEDLKSNENMKHQVVKCLT